MRLLLDRGVRWVQRYVANPLVRTVLERGLPVPGVALLETTGRHSGQPRRTPVTNGLAGDTFWVIAERGRSAQYVRNIEADPRVRVKVRGRWRTGHAQALPGEDPARRAHEMPARLSAAVTRALATDALVIRIDLDPP